MSRKVIVGPDAVCKHGHIGQYRLTSKGHAQCGQCYRELRRRRYQNPEIREAELKYYRDNYKRIMETMMLRRKNPIEHEKNLARLSVSNKIRKGTMVKEPCRDCGNIKVDFHHTHGYTGENRNKGIWLCRKHHLAEHVRVRESKIRKSLK